MYFKRFFNFIYSTEFDLWTNIKNIIIHLSDIDIHIYDGMQPFVLFSPCEHKLIIKDYDEMISILKAKKDIMCSCGDPRHYFVKFDGDIKNEK